MQRVLITAALFGAAGLAVGTLVADEPKKDAKAAKKDVGKMMKDVHRGEKSAHVRLEAELKKDAPDWEQIAKSAKAFTEMGEAFKGVDLGYASPTKYVASAGALTKAADAKDKKATAEAFTAMTKTCAGCHSYGGPGGALK